MTGHDPELPGAAIMVLVVGAMLAAIGAFLLGAMWVAERLW